MNEKDPFIIEDLDEYHIIIKADEEYRVRKELEAEVRTFLFLRGCQFSRRSILFSWKRIHIAWKPVNDDFCHTAKLPGSRAVHVFVSG